MAKPGAKPAGNDSAAQPASGIDHDGLFKELLRVCFVDFLEAFAPQVLEYLDVTSVEFVDKEYFSPVARSKKRAVDLVVKARFKGKPTHFLIHIEVESSPRAAFRRRFFLYYAILTERQTLPVYPIVVFSYDRPLRAAPAQYVVDFPDRRVLEFNYVVIQLNRLNWRDYLRRDNPAVSALMAKMGVRPEERPKVKAACFRMIARLKLRPEKYQPIIKFIDAYLQLTPEQEQEFQREVGRLAPTEREATMEYITSWERKGREIGKAEGKLEDTLKLLTWRLGELSQAMQKRISRLPLDKLDKLFDATFDFEQKADLNAWLRKHAVARRAANGVSRQ